MPSRLSRRWPLSRIAAWIRISQTAGGRIIKDKLFPGVGAFEHVRVVLPSRDFGDSGGPLTFHRPPQNLSNPIPFSQSVYFYMGKADWQINQNNRLSGRFNYFRNESPFNNGGGQTLATQTYLFKDRAPVGAVQLISTLSPNMVNEFRFAIPKRFQPPGCLRGALGRNLPSPFQESRISAASRSGRVWRSLKKTPQWSDNLSYTRGTPHLQIRRGLRYILDNQTQQQFAKYTFGSIDNYLAAKNGTNPSLTARSSKPLGTRR